MRSIRTPLTMMRSSLFRLSSGSSPRIAIKLGLTDPVTTWVANLSLNFVGYLIVAALTVTAATHLPGRGPSRAAEAAG